jgi:hypothetical protein
VALVTLFAPEPYSEIKVFANYLVSSLPKERRFNNFRNLAIFLVGYEY